MRISRRTSSTSASLRRPRPRRRVKIPSKRSVRLSNMGSLRLPDRTGAGTSDRARRSAAGSEQRVDELLGIEVDEVVGALAQADQLDREAELALDGDHDAALGRAVELGQHDAR